MNKSIKFFVMMYFFLGFTSILPAQSLEDQQIELYSTLDQSQVPTGLLMNRAMGFVYVPDYDGQVLVDSVSLKGSQYPFVYAMLHNADVDTSPLQDGHSVFQLTDWWRKQAAIEMGALVYEYGSIKPYAVDSNLITLIDTHYYDVPGRIESPYFKDTLYAFAAFKNKVEGLTHTFHLRSSIFNSNITGAFDSIEIDFDDGQGYRSTSVDDVWVITYPDYDTVHIKTKFTMSGGEVRYAHTPFIVNPVSSGLGGPPADQYNVDPDDSIMIVTTCIDTIIHEIDEQGGQTDTIYEYVDCSTGITIQWWYNQECEDDQIRKPLIIIEGIDPFNRFNFRFLMAPNTNGLLDDHYGDENFITMKDKFHSEGYDIFYINFLNSTDYIQNNAALVKLAIDTINTLKHQSGSYEKNVVVGASMGGLVGLWALREFERNGADHETETYMTFDSPLKGGNISLGLQTLLSHVIKIKVTIQSLLAYKVDLKMHF